MERFHEIRQLQFSFLLVLKKLSSAGFYHYKKIMHSISKLNPWEGFSCTKKDQGKTTFLLMGISILAGELKNGLKNRCLILADVFS